MRAALLIGLLYSVAATVPLVVVPGVALSDARAAWAALSVKLCQRKPAPSDEDEWVDERGREPVPA